MYKKIKRIIDCYFALLILSLFLPIFIVISVLLFLVNNGKVFFKQERIGLNNQKFILWKFQTMSNQKDNKGQLLPDSQRLTFIGKGMRKTSLDELPQMWNILKGEMSFIGPRPLLVEYLPLYSDRHICRHNILPGITGWAQVHGRNFLEWEERFEHDVWYVTNISFFVDLKIVFLTIQTVLFQSQQVNTKEGKLVEKFKGYKK